MLGLDAPQALAIGLHAVSAVAGIIVACVVFRKGDVALGGAALCAATLLVSPYLFFYDFTTLLVGAALLGAPRFKNGASGTQYSGPWVEVAEYFASWKNTLGLAAADQHGIAMVFTSERHFRH